MVSGLTNLASGPLTGLVFFCLWSLLSIFPELHTLLFAPFSLALLSMPIRYGSLSLCTLTCHEVLRNTDPEIDGQDTRDFRPSVQPTLVPEAHSR